MNNYLARLLESSALLTTMVVIACPPALAQSPAPSQTQISAQSPANELEEVIVTAERRSENVNHVPMSISVEKAQDLDDQNIRSALDLQRLIPDLAVSGQTGSVATFSIRGIASSAGAATTGIYLDDTPIQRRNTLSAFQVNGTPFPSSFDIDRVEVLLGPQGTLYGGSSEGGTLRYILAQPSLSTYSVDARAKLATTLGGGPTYETDAAIGGPIIDGKLGFRAMVYSNAQGGYIDLVDAYGRGTIANANSDYTKALRFALKAQPSPDLTIELADYFTNDQVHDQNGASTLPINSTLTTLPQCFNGSITPVSCSGKYSYLRPAYTYGPYPNLGPGKYLETGYFGTSPAATELNVGSMTVGYTPGYVDLKSITSLIHDEARARTAEGTAVNETFIPGISSTAGLFSPMQDYDGVFQTSNTRNGVVEELRATSDLQGPLHFVAGGFFSLYKTTSLIDETQPQLPQLVEDLYGLTLTQRYKVLNASGATTAAYLLPGNITLERDQYLSEREYAAYGEMTYDLTSALSLTAGVRVSDTKFSFSQVYQGVTAGKIPPSSLNGGLTSGTDSETPVTPKFNVKYQITDNEMVYATAAKGYRIGGVNAPLPGPVCGPGLAAVGLTADSEPATYQSDSVWSYETGVKVKEFDNRLSISASAYRVDWSNVQLAVSIPNCSVSFTMNAGTAVSQGLEFQSEMKLLPGLTGRVSASYDDAKYTQNAYGPLPTNGAPVTPIVLAGDRLPTPPVTATASVTYDAPVSDDWDGFGQMSYQWQKGYTVVSGPGTLAYTPDNAEAFSHHFLSARAGLKNGSLDVAIYGNNILNFKEPLAISGGRTSCSATVNPAACSVYSSYNPISTATYLRPTEVGVELNYHF